MSKRMIINEEQLDSVTGGKITYTWDGSQGSLGMNGVNKYILLDKNAFIKVYNEMSSDYNDAEIIRALREQHIIVKP